MDSKAAAAFIERTVPAWTAATYHASPYPYNAAFKENRNNEVDLIHKCHALNKDYREAVKQRKHCHDRILFNLRYAPWKNTKAAFIEYEKLDQQLKAAVREMQQVVLDLEVETRARRAVYSEVLQKAWQCRKSTRDEQHILKDYHQGVEYEIDLVALFDRHEEKSSQGVDLYEHPAANIFKVIGDEPRGVIGALVHWLMVNIWKLLVALVPSY